MSEAKSMAEKVLDNQTQPSERNDPAVVKHNGPQRLIEVFDAICDEIFERWDKGQRSGKLLSAMAGRVPSYRADVTQVRRALEAHADMLAALKFIASGISSGVTPEDTSEKFRAAARAALAKAEPSA